MRCNSLAADQSIINLVGVRTEITDANLICGSIGSGYSDSWNMRQLLITVLFTLTVLTYAHADKGANQLRSASVADQLRALSVRHDIRIKGIEKTRNTLLAANVNEKPNRQIQYLLEGFNYLSIENSGGEIEAIIITGKKTGGPRPVILSTKRQGHQHLVNVTLMGNYGGSIDALMMVDTGADFIVLPKSMSGELGITLNELKSAKVQTANGLVDARVGTLQEVKIGADTLTGVAVAFIDDKSLGGSKLLGMSVLSQYRMTIDDQQQRITLIRRN